MPIPTPAQEEFADLVAKSSASDTDRVHPEDRAAAREERTAQKENASEEDEFRNAQIDAAMRVPTFDRLGGGVSLKLPPPSFDSNHSTGVKGVIADARSYEMARRGKWRNVVRTARRSIFGLDGNVHKTTTDSETDGEGSGSDLPDEEMFLQQWRESRRRELESEAVRGIRTRRTSPSVRIYGRFDEVDAMGYLDAIEKVGRETVVVVFVYDPECMVSAEIEKALVPLVGNHPTAHFVKVHYEDIEFDNAGVPAILAYKNQGDLIANLTGLMEMIPEEDDFGSDSLRRLFQRHHIL